MSIDVIVPVLNADPSVIRSSVKLVAVLLANHAHKDGGSAYPSVRRMSRVLGVSERHVQNSLRELEAAGIIRVQRRADAARRVPTVYAFNLDALHNIRRDHRNQRRDIHGSGDAHSFDAVQDAGDPPHHSEPSCELRAPKTSLKHPFNHQKNTTGEPTERDRKRISKRLHGLVKETQTSNPDWPKIQNQAMRYAQQLGPDSQEYLTALQLAGYAESEIRKYRDLLAKGSPR